MWVHAHNMVQFGVWHAAGLSDEAYNPEAAAHPYVYTHEGNFPRFFVYALMRLGITSVEWQIAVSAVLIGGATIYLCFRFFSRLGSDLFAFLVCAVLATDYLLFMQWEVNTFRVWQGLLFFLSLVCVQGLGGRRSRTAGVLLFFTAVALFYFEIVFALFTATMAVCYALLTFWRRWRAPFAATVLLCVGAFVAVGGLFIQSAVHLGWKAARDDIGLTFLARNFYRQTSTTSVPLEFYVAHHIVYWLDQPNTQGHLHLDAFLSTIGATAQIDTPYLLLLACVIVMAWLCRLGMRFRFLHGFHQQSSIRSQGPGIAVSAASSCLRWRAAGVGALLLGLSYAIVSMAVRAGSPLQGDSQTAQYTHIPGFVAHWLAFPTSSISVATIALAAVIAFGALSYEAPLTTLRWRRGTISIDAQRLFAWSADTAARVSLQSCALVGLFLYLAGHYESFHARLYGTDKAALWMGAIAGYFHDRVLQAGLIGAGLLGMLIILDGGRSYLPLHADRSLAGTLRYLIAGAMAFMIVYMIFPGYLWAGYVSRYAPLPVFLLDVWIAMFFYVLVAVAWDSGRDVLGIVRRRVHVRNTASSRGAIVRPHLFAVTSVLLLIFSLAYWARVQTVYFEALPPTDYLFVRQLARAPYVGATVITNNYAAPIAYYTRTWAYEDPLVQDDRYIVKGGQPMHVIAGYYLWEADRLQNSAYTRPRYYVCITNPDLSLAADLVALRRGERLVRCSGQPIVRNAMASMGRFHNRLIARDPSPRDLWAIVELDTRVPLTPLH